MITFIKLSNLFYVFFYNNTLLNKILNILMNSCTIKSYFFANCYTFIESSDDLQKSHIYIYKIQYFWLFGCKQLTPVALL